MTPWSCRFGTHRDPTLACETIGLALRRTPIITLRGRVSERVQGPVDQFCVQTTDITIEGETAPDDRRAEPITFGWQHRRDAYTVCHVERPFRTGRFPAFTTTSDHPNTCSKATQNPKKINTFSNRFGTHVRRSRRRTWVALILNLLML